MAFAHRSASENVPPAADRQFRLQRNGDTIMPEHALELQNLLDRLGCLDRKYREGAIFRHGKSYYLISKKNTHELGPYERAKSRLWEMLRQLVNSSRLKLETVAEA
jgi:hypothetical protein